jgi:hypothetical protein
MRRSLQLIALLGTAVILIATSRAPTPCATEVLNVRAETTCGAPANLALSSARDCTLTVTGGELTGLPRRGDVNQAFADSGIAMGFQLLGTTADGGNEQFCQATPEDGGFHVRCTPTCGAEADAGPCDSVCEGSLTTQ